MLKKKEAIRIIEKVKWSGKVAKLAQLSKLLKSVLTSPKLEPNIIVDYLLLENTIFKYIYMYHDKKDDIILNGCKLDEIENFRHLLNPILNTNHSFIEENLMIDIRCLDILLDFLIKDYKSVILKFNNLNENIKINELTFDKTCKYTIKIVSEICIYYIISCFYENTTVDGKI